MKTPSPSPLLAAAALLAGLPAQAARPLLTDDAAVIAPRACELEGGRRVGPAGHDLALACGLGFDSQAGVAALRDHADGATVRGLALQGKTGLWSGTGDDAPALALGWTLAWAAEPAAGYRRAATALRLLATLPLEGLQLHANLGTLHDELAARRDTCWGLAVEAAPLAAGPLAWAPMAELFGDDRGDRRAALGLRLTVLPERLFADLSWSRPLGRDGGRTLAAGFKLAF